MVTGESNLTSTSKSASGVAWSRRGTSSTPVQRSCLVPAGTAIRACDPVLEALESPSGSIHTQRLVSSVAALNSSEVSDAGQAAVVNVPSGEAASLPDRSTDRIWK